jgi:hypothetical protein
MEIAEPHDRQLLESLYWHTVDHRRWAVSFAELCDTLHIPREVRKALLLDLLDRRLIVREGGWVSLTKEGRRQAAIIGLR